ncbi:SDR family NAD(P)-dependent oxidoreductase [Flammeovirga agarivorans]|uniref:SDR family NAD(P)-dependent oxidoreductase n=1 Tax=Flammeovirga agarivorans TaxID=2726742 RepID=A0A7X8SME6_9BACT|nr:SDR family NAD(P)-dependent oxidoreductase [Flammeovirga agarivorans]NLR92832.1 SDR family NAD(P)-dependent oxidoreductase [Flammeovirga agarivorans]
MKKTRFENKVCWVIGASSGIGYQLASDLSLMNTKLILSGRNEQKLTTLSRSLKVDSSVLPLDLSDQEEALASKVKQAEAIYSQIDIVFFVGGISQRSSFLETATSTFEQIMKVNFWGAVHITKSILPHLLKANDPIIVVINSVQGKFGIPNRSAYASSKHALLGFFDSLRAELGNQKIQITSILPGYVKTDLAKNALLGDGSQQGHLEDGKGGISTEQASKDILHFTSVGKSEAVIGRPREKAAVLIKRFFPSFFEKLVRKKS